MTSVHKKVQKFAEEKFLKLYGLITNKNRIKNHALNNAVKFQNVNFIRRALRRNFET